MLEKYSLIVALIFAVGGIGIASSQSEGVNQSTTINSVEWKEYDSPANGFKIKYPADWEAEESKNVRLVEFGISPSNSSGIFSDLLAIVTYDLENNETIQKILSDDISERQENIDYTKNFAISKPNKTSISNGIESFQYQYSYDIGDETNKGLSIISIIDGLEYHFHYTTYHTGDFEKYLPTIKKIINSFEPIVFDFK